MSLKENLIKDILIVIPAKGNSTRLKNKNIFNINGKKLIEFTLDLIKKKKLVKNTFVSSNSNIIKEITAKNGINFIKRPEKLCKIESSTESAIIHSINYLKKKNKIFKWVITLPPTSPLRTEKNLMDVIKLINTNKYDSIITLCKNRGYFWIKDKKNEFKFKKLFNKASRRQQERNFLYEETSSVYANKINTLLNSHSIINGRIGFVKTLRSEALDINDKTDIEYLKNILK